MTSRAIQHSELKPSDLPGILRYVQIFRDQTFVIGIDQAVTRAENFSSILQEIAVLASLNIRLWLFVYDYEECEFFFVNPNCSQFEKAIHGAIKWKQISIQSERDSALASKSLSNDEPSANNHHVNLIKPSTEGLSFRESGFLERLCKSTPIHKLIFLGTNQCPVINGEPLTNIAADELKDSLNDRVASPLPNWFLDYGKLAIFAIEQGIERVHILNCKLHHAVLNELFDKIGIGTMVHANKYEILREAQFEDVPAIYHLTKNSVKKETLLNRSIDTIQEKVSDYRVYEIDGSIVACTCMQYFQSDRSVEIGSVFVQPYYNGRGIGRKLVNDACEKAKAEGYHTAFVLTVNAAVFFESKCAFSPGELCDLPTERQQTYRANQRDSKVFKKELTD